ncbi:substrate-binding domain-containing protein [Rickettsiales bacterium LUAb2]
MKLKNIYKLSALIVLNLILSFHYAQARDSIRIVGSSTVYPFSTTLTEYFANNTGYINPIVESTGTGGGFAIFCQGVGFDYPDINDASRAISQSEIDNCAKNGIINPLEIKIGYDGIGLLYSKALGQINFTKKQLFLALAAKVPSKEDPNKWVPNYYKKWSDIDKSLPNIPIKVLGPPSTSGTRDTFIEIILQDNCPINKKNTKFSADELKDLCSRIRYDGAWLDGSENYNLVIQKIKDSTSVIAIVGYSYYELNKHTVNAASIDGVKLTKDNIRKDSYPLSRPLFIYVKREHLNNIPHLKEFVQYIDSEHILGPNGILSKKGLVPLSKEDYKQVSSNITKALQ